MQTTRFLFITAITTALLLTILVLAIACDSQPSSTPASEPVSTPIGASGIQMTVTVNGLGKGEEAVLRLLPDTDTA